MHDEANVATALYSGRLRRSRWENHFPAIKQQRVGAFQLASIAPRPHSFSCAAVRRKAPFVPPSLSVSWFTLARLCAARVCVRTVIKRREWVIVRSGCTPGLSRLSLCARLSSREAGPTGTAAHTQALARYTEKLVASLYSSQILTWFFLFKHGLSVQREYKVTLRTATLNQFNA